MRSFRFQPVRAGRYLVLAGLLSLLAAQAFGAGTAIAADKIVCYAVADDGNGAGSGSDSGAEDLLTRIDPDDADPATNETSIGTGTGTFNVEAATFQPGTEVLFAVNEDRLGTIDLSTGVFSGKASTIGSGSGSNGVQDFDDVDGITFDPDAGTLYGLSRQQGAETDLLIKINPSTGAHIPDAFGAGNDYVEIDSIGNLTNGDDLAIGSNGTLYGILSDGGHGDHLVTINKATGETTDVGALGVNDMEGLSIAPDGRLFGTTGQESSEGEGLWDLSKTTGAASNGRVLDNAGDYEAVACLAEAGTGPSPSPSPSPSVIPTETETAGPNPQVSPTVQGTKVIAETGPGSVPVLFVLGLAFIVAGFAMIRITGAER